MNFDPTSEQESIQDLAERVCSRFDDGYWLDCDRKALFPHDFYAAIADAGLLGIAMPEAFGGSDLGIAAAATLMRTIAESGAGMAGASSVHMNIFGLQPVVAFGTPEQQARMLPPLIRGEEKACFAVTEPDAGLNTTELKVKAEREGDVYLISGQKIWISTAQVADRALILARTTPLEQRVRKTDGLSLFYAKLDRSKADIRVIEKMGRHGVDSNTVFFDRMEVPAEDRIGEEGNGFKMILHGLNPERILIAAEAVGIGRAALRRASDYARERVVFGRPIGQNQGIQHPLARCWMNLEAANLMVMKAAARFDGKLDSGVDANAAKYLAAEAAFSACETAVQTLGGMGYAAEYHVERYMRECFIPRIAPVSPQMIMNFIAEKVLDLPKSY
ncbi:acyl-CoA/acyl-ACP dehydrogenase [Sphingobium phenoxybenzoativorans]|uniref:Acyl-CoA/acyl-ACP dehydrogenase n=1 Tax=Sphingobium phenoxybenzoativorans TaxID=1592790 RepID=A0A975KB37_9SPHN|nr:acyl-CoA/acyl-ACP dehydrogenase [Sphingobium phenoxybenzoativorans]